jgi:hypothetical protein
VEGQKARKLRRVGGLVKRQANLAKSNTLEWRWFSYFGR